nr:MAG TPA: tail protein [Caudoviricetes sp.]
MADKKVNKVVYGGEVLIDLTGDTVTADKVLKGYTAHDKSGETITGTCNYDVNSEDATVAVAEMLVGKTAYARGSKITGTMPNNGAVKESISTKAQEVTIAQGYHDGSGKIAISSTEQAKIIATNIRNGVTILGVTGTMSGTEGAKAQAKTVTPTTAVQNVLPDAGYNYLSQVTVNAIPYVESENAAGGTTVTIG